MRAVRGAKDLVPSEYFLFEKVINSAAKIAKRYGFQNFYTPIMEYSEVFNKTLGETSDVVHKEMYSFVDRGGDSITLRPEFTAGIMRAIITEGLTHSLPLRLFSHGPLFRHDRPQAGRQRQFHQINFEIIGDSSEKIDAEAVKIGYDIIKDLDILDVVSIDINSLGCQDTRASYHAKLKEYLLKYENDLSEDSQKRLHKNPMRILDSKNENDQKILQDAPLISESYTNDTKSRFESTLLLLEELGVPFQINHKLVRGLDYYCHTAFEYTTKSIGAQTAIGGGGRYDGLAKMMSPKHDIPSIGLACGIERFMILLAAKENFYNFKHITIIPIGDDAINSAYLLADKLRSEDIATIVFADGKLAKRIDKASKTSKFAIFMGQDEINSSIFKLKNLETGEEMHKSLGELKEFLKLEN